MIINNTQTRPLSSFQLFPIGLGAMPLSLIGRPARQEAYRVIEKFIEQGGNFIDTADVYGLDDTDRGHNETLIREVINSCGATDVIVATKGGATRPNGGWSFVGGGKPANLRQTCEQSLINLNREQHDLYYLHGPDKEVPYLDSLSELIRLKEEGKIKNIGIANVDIDILKLACQTTQIAAVQNRCNLFCKMDLYNGVIDFCKQNKIAYISYCPLGGWSEHNVLKKTKLLESLLQKYQTSYYEICLAWLLQQNSAIIPIPGMDNEQQVAVNFNSIQLKLDAEDLYLISSLPESYSPIHID